MVLTNVVPKMTKDWLLDRVSEMQIYEYYVTGIKQGRKMKSPIRLDKHEGSWSIKQIDGVIVWSDWATDEKGNCITLVQKMYNITYQQAIEKIAQDLGIQQGSNQISRVAIPSNLEGVPDQKKHSWIQIVTRRWNTKDDQFWGKYAISREQLIADGVLPIKEYYINRQKEIIKEGEKVYAYTYDEGMKIYMPERVKNDKWRSSISTKLVEGLDKLNGHEKVVVCKSKKDKLTLMSILPESVGIISVQNESVSAWTDNLLKVLEGRKVWISYDSDGPGKAASKRVNERYPWMKHINVPDNWTPIKDWSDMVAAGHRQEVVEHFRNKEVI